MSLINEMLNNLESRRAEGVRKVSNDIRPLPPVRTESRGRWIVGIALILAALAALIHAAGLLENRSQNSSRSAKPAPVVLPGIDDVPGLPKLTASAQPTTSPPVEVIPPAQSPGEGAAGRGEIAIQAPTRSVEPPPRAAVTGAQEREPTLRLARSVDAPSAPLGGTGSTSRPLAANPPVSGEIDKRPSVPSARERSDAAYRAASTALAQGRPEDAAQELRAVLRDDPAYELTRHLLLKILLDSRAYDELRSTLQAGLERLPGRVEWALLLSRLQVDRGEIEESLQTIARAEHAAPSNAVLKGAAGAILQKAGRAAEAEAKYAEAVRLQPNDGRWMLGYAIAMEAQGRLRESREAFARARTGQGLSPDQQAFAARKLEVEH